MVYKEIGTKYVSPQLLFITEDVKRPSVAWKQMNTVECWIHVGQIFPCLFPLSVQTEHKLSDPHTQWKCWRNRELKITTNQYSSGPMVITNEMTVSMATNYVLWEDGDTINALVENMTGSKSTKLVLYDLRICLLNMLYTYSQQYFINFLKWMNEWLKETAIFHPYRGKINFLKFNSISEFCNLCS